MANLYLLLCVPNNASSADIQAAIAKQQQLGRIPAASLKLAAECLLNPERRAQYDAQLGGEDPSVGMAQSAEELAMVAATPAPQSLSRTELAAHHDNTDDVVVYTGFKRPETLAKAVSMTKTADKILWSPWFLLVVLLGVFALFKPTPQQAFFDMAESECMAAIKKQLTYPDRFQAIANEPPRVQAWRHGKTEYEVHLDYIAEPVYNSPQPYTARCLYNSKQKQLTSFSVTTH